MSKKVVGKIILKIKSRLKEFPKLDFENKFFFEGF